MKLRGLFFFMLVLASVFHSKYSFATNPASELATILESNIKIGVEKSGEVYRHVFVVKAERGFCKRLVVHAVSPSSIESLLNEISLGSFSIEYKLMTSSDVCISTSSGDDFFVSDQDSKIQFVTEKVMNLIWDWRSGKTRSLTVIGSKKHLACLKDPKSTMIFGIKDERSNAYSMKFYNNNCSSEETNLRIALSAKYVIEENKLILSSGITYLQP